MFTKNIAPTATMLAYSELGNESITLWNKGVLFGK